MAVVKMATGGTRLLPTRVWLRAAAARVETSKK